MDTLLEAIDVCDVDGFCYGNYTDEEAGTGCTVIVAPEGATGGVDVRGGAPASRETDLLRPENTVDKVHAVCLSGGSAFGLEAASGVARELESRGIGLPVARELEEPRHRPSRRPHAGAYRVLQLHLRPRLWRSHRAPRH